MPARSQPRPGRARYVRAVALLIAWVVGLELAPSLHLAWHDVLEPHEHEPVGPRVTVHYDDHPHRHGPDGEHLDDEADEDAPPRQPAPDHGDGALAHRAAALPPLPSPILAPPAIWIAASLVLPASPNPPDRTPAPRLQARDPPA